MNPDGKRCAHLGKAQATDQKTAPPPVLAGSGATKTSSGGGTHASTFRRGAINVQKPHGATDASANVGIVTQAALGESTGS